MTENTMVKREETGTKNDLQNNTWKSQDQETRTPLIPGMNSGARKGKQFLLH